MFSKVQKLVVLGLSLLSAAFANEFENQSSEYQAQAEASGETIQKALKRKSRAVPIVLPVSNPTVGAGLGGGVLYLHEKGADANPDDPATMTGVFAMYTDTESWAFGGFHSGSYRDESIRVSVPVAHGEFHLKYYGVGDNSPFRENPLNYDATGNMFVPEASMELPIDNWFVGGKYRIIDIDTQFSDNDPTDSIPGFNARQKTAGFGLVTTYDTRDSNLWPRRGCMFDFSGMMNGHYAGGDYNYFKTGMKWVQYFTVSEPVTFVYRIDGEYISGDAPFWDLARIRLRGFSSGQYLDDVAVTWQAEIRWNIYGRWHVSAFGGGGA
jgi:hypothetical protein